MKSSKMKHTTILAFFRESFFGKYILPITIVLSIFLTDNTVLFALGGGPSTPESSSFSPLQPDQLVNTFTGSFSYSIPLLNIGGYPLGLKYNSNPSMEQDASWVGLGWDLNVGAINRQMKGLPDDFNGDQVTQENNMKPNITGKLTFSGKIIDEIVGKQVNIKGVNLNFSLGYNNYNGFLLNYGANLDLKFKSKTKNTEYPLSSSIGISAGSGGLTLSPNVSLAQHFSGKESQSKGSFGFGFNMNSNTGIQSTVFYNFSYTQNQLQTYSHSFGYSPFSYTPVTPLMYENYSINVTFKPAKLELMFVDGGVTINGSFFMQKLKQKTQHTPAYGYLYLRNGQSGHILTDINTEKAVTYMPGLPHLPITYMQPDIFNVNVDGIGGTYRAFKNTGMVVYKAENTGNSGKSLDLAVEVGGGNVVKNGINMSFSSSKTFSGPWVTKNNVGSKATNVNLHNGFENCYFKRTNEPSKGIRSSYYNVTGQEYPFGYRIDGNNFNYCLTSNNIQTMTVNGNSVTFNGDSLISAAKYSRLPEQATSFVALKNSMVLQHPYYNILYRQYIHPVNSVVEPHHITQIQVVADNGLKYVFGCPAYQHTQQEVSFNVDGSSTEKTISYNPSDASVNNDNGRSHYFSKKTIPAYVYAYHLTEVYSPDYSDLTGNGPTEDDYGNYILFRYSRKIDHYKWRAPYGEHQAYYNEGAFSLDDDNTASYTYGEKDIWYVDTIRTKDQIAVFYTSPRNDACAVKGEHGDIDSNISMLRLDSIKLWNLQDFKQLGAQAATLKVIRLKYSYSLCKNLPSNKYNDGKLTLEKVIITTGTSNEEQRSVYSFEYGKIPNSGVVVNHNYNIENIDRWGFYQQADALKQIYPYTRQDDTLNIYKDAYNWNLTHIHLPTGATISVEYEPNDYRFVQDKKAMRMFKLYGVGSSLSSINSGTTLGINKNVLYFETDIPSSLPQAEAQYEFNRYFQESVNNNLYFKAKVNVNRLSSVNYPGTRYDYVFGFAEVQSKKVIQHNGKYYGAIQLKNVSHNNAQYNAIKYAAIQYSLVNTPRYFNDQPMINEGGGVMDLVENFALNVANNLTSVFNGVIAIIQGPFLNASTQGIGKHIQPSKSWIRLTVRDKKYGGGSRVKRVTYKNNWKSLTHENHADIKYIKEYEYLDEQGLSSGVASYEPMVGGDEIPQRIAVSYENTSSSFLGFTRKLMPVAKHFYYYPIGEMQYPGPSIGYSRVTETTILPSTGQIANGKTVSTFYTAKDFPVKAYYTFKDEHTPKLTVPALFYSLSKNHAVVSEGFSVVLNDMHGRPKTVETFDGLGNVIKKMVYHYFNPGKKIPYYNKTNHIEYAYPGLETDVTVYMTEEKAIDKSNGGEGNLDGSPVPPIIPVLPLLSYYTNGSYDETYYRSCSVSKVVYQSGQIKSIDIQDRGANVSKKVIAYHPVGGGELIAATKDKFGYTYSYGLPANYAYPQMNPASKNAGLYVNVTTNSSGKITGGSSNLTDGDRLIRNGNFYWVLADASSNNKYLIDKTGNTIGNISGKFFVETSGYRNMFAQQVEQVTCKNNPVNNNAVQINTNNRIISAGASTFTDFYSYPCDTCLYQCDPHSYSFDTTFSVSQSEIIELPANHGTQKATLTAAVPNNNQQYFSLVVSKSAGLTITHRLFLRKHTSSSTLWHKELIIPDNTTTRFVDWYVTDVGIFVLKEKVKSSVVGHKSNRTQNMKTPPPQNCPQEMAIQGDELYLAYYDLNGNLLRQHKITYDPPNLPGIPTGINNIRKHARDIIWAGDAIYIAGSIGWTQAGVKQSAAYIMMLKLSGQITKIKYFKEIHEIYELAANNRGIYAIGDACQSSDRPLVLLKLSHALDVFNSKLVLYQKVIGNPKQYFSNYSGVKLLAENNRIYVAGLFRSSNTSSFLSLLEFSPQLQLLTLKNWRYSSQEATGIFDMKKTGNNLLLTGYDQVGGKYIRITSGGNIQTRATEYQLHSVAGHSVQGILFAGTLATNSQRGQYYYTDINGDIAGCTQSISSQPVSNIPSTTNINISDALGKLDTFNATVTEQPVNFVPVPGCGEMSAHITVRDACECQAQISVHLSPGYPNIVSHWNDATGTLQSFNDSIFTIDGICTGNYSLVIEDTDNQTSWTLDFTIGQSVLDTTNLLVVNPFIHQLKNRWRPDKQWVLDTLRTPYLLSQPVHLNTQGHFKHYTRFWTPQAGGWNTTGASSGYWRAVNYTTYHDRFGNPTESIDLIGNYSSAYFAYNGTLQEALVYNARSNEIGFDSFEDYYKEINTPQAQGHFRFTGDKQKVSAKYAHTGLYSLRLKPNEHISYKTLIKKYIQGNPPPNPSQDVPFKIHPDYCSDVFAPFDSTRIYLASVWIKKTVNGNYQYGQSSGLDGFFKVLVNGQAIPIRKVFESPEIEGWVQYKYEFVLRASACDEFEIRLMNKITVATGEIVAPWGGGVSIGVGGRVKRHTYYFDDLKIEPKDALMKTYVYHPYRKMLMAELDENNFSSKYYYNYKDELEEVIKETERGELFIVYKKSRKVQK